MHNRPQTSHHRIYLVHRDGERLMRFQTDRAETHGSRCETLDDFRCRFNFGQGKWLIQSPEFQTTAQHAVSHGFHCRFFEFFVRGFVFGHRGFLKGRDASGVVQMLLSTRTPMETARVSEN